MNYVVGVEFLPAKDFLIIKGFIELDGNESDSYAASENKNMVSS